MAKQTKTPADQQSQTMATYDWSQAGVTGLEATRPEDLGIPYLAILHAQSPQVNKADKNYAAKKIEGAGAGDIINTIANTVVYRQGGEPLEFIPCFHERLFVEWTPRDKGGGIVKPHRNQAILNETTKNDKGQDILRNGNIIATTSYFAGIALINGEKVRCIIGMTSTQLKKAKKWLNQITSIKLAKPDGTKYLAPMFSHSYLLSTGPESNEEGSWFGWNVELKGQLSDPMLITSAIEIAKEAATSQRLALSAPSEEHDDKKPPFA
jgi:hypothetical protein